MKTSEWEVSSGTRQTYPMVRVAYLPFMSEGVRREGINYPGCHTGSLFFLLPTEITASNMIFIILHCRKEI